MTRGTTNKACCEIEMERTDSSNSAISKCDVDTARTLDELRVSCISRAKEIFEEGPGRKRGRDFFMLPEDSIARKKAKKVESAHVSRYSKRLYETSLEAKCSASEQRIALLGLQAEKAQEESKLLRLEIEELERRLREKSRNFPGHGDRKRKFNDALSVDSVNSKDTIASVGCGEIQSLWQGSEHGRVDGTVEGELLGLEELESLEELSELLQPSSSSAETSMLDVLSAK